MTILIAFQNRGKLILLYLSYIKSKRNRMKLQDLKMVVSSIVEDTIDHQFHTLAYGNNSHVFWNLIKGSVKVGAFRFQCSTAGIVAGNRSLESQRTYNIVHSHFDGIVNKLVRYIIASNLQDHWFLQQVRTKM